MRNLKDQFNGDFNNAKNEYDDTKKKADQLAKIYEEKLD